MKSMSQHPQVMSLGYPLLGFTRRPGDSPLGHAHAGAAKGQKSIRAVAYCGAKLEDLSPDILFPLDGPPVFSKDGEPVPLYHGGHPRACKACGQELLRLRRAKLAEMANQS